MPAYKWSGLAEVTNNVSALYVQHHISGENRLDNAGHQQSIRDFFALPVAERDFHESSVWVKLLMFDQFRRAFGNAVNPRLNQEIRTSLALGDVPYPATDQESRDLFAETMSRIVNRDLTEFFRQWALPLSEQTIDSMSRRPALEHEIWNNRLSTDPIVEEQVRPYRVPIGDVVLPNGLTVTPGQKQLGADPEVANLGNSDGADNDTVSAGRHWIETDAWYHGAVNVEGVNGDGVRNALSAPAPVEKGNSFQFRGVADRAVMVLALDPQASALRVVPGSTAAAHERWPDQEYVGFELRNADDTESVGSWSVKGNENAYALAHTFQSTYENGQIVLVRHQEARTRLKQYADGVLQPADSDTVQKYRIVDDRFVSLDPGPPVVAVTGAAMAVEFAEGDSTVLGDIPELASGTNVAGATKLTLTNAGPTDAVVSTVKIEGVAVPNDMTGNDFVGLYLDSNEVPNLMRQTLAGVDRNLFKKITVPSGESVDVWAYLWGQNGKDSFKKLKASETTFDITLEYRKASAPSSASGTKVQIGGNVLRVAAHG